MVGTGPSLGGGLVMGAGGVRLIGGGGGRGRRRGRTQGEPRYMYPLGGGGDQFWEDSGDTCDAGGGGDEGGGGGENPTPFPWPTDPGDSGGGGGHACPLSVAAGCNNPPGTPQPVPIPGAGSTYTTSVAVKGSAPGPCSFGAVGIRVTCVNTGATAFTSGCPRPSGGTTNAQFYNNTLTTLNFTTPGGEGTACSPPTFPAKSYGSGSASAMAGSMLNIAVSCS